MRRRFISLFLSADAWHRRSYVTLIAFTRNQMAVGCLRWCVRGKKTRSLHFLFLHLSRSNLTFAASCSTLLYFWHYISVQVKSIRFDALSGVERIFWNSRHCFGFAVLLHIHASKVFGSYLFVFFRDRTIQLARLLPNWLIDLFIVIVTIFTVGSGIFNVINILWHYIIATVLKVRMTFAFAWFPEVEVMHY